MKLSITLFKWTFLKATGVKCGTYLNNILSILHLFQRLDAQYVEPLF